MGHVRLGVLPRTKLWNRVVEKLRLGAGVEAVAASVADAAETSLQTASKDPAFLHAFWLLTQIPLAARDPAFAEILRDLGVQVRDQASFMDLVAAITEAGESHTRGRGHRTDLGEMAQMAAIETVTALVGPKLPSLFEPGPEELQRELGYFATGDRFGALAREFFARLTQRCLDYFLSRELNRHIGADERFADDTARARFDVALGWHCWEVSRVVEDLACEWYEQNVYLGDGLTPGSVGKFAPFAFKRIRTELRKHRDAEG